MTTEDNALRLLASFDWKPEGKHLTANSAFDPVMAEAIKQDLDKDVRDGIGLHFIGSRAYLSKESEAYFKIEGFPLRVCREQLSKAI